MPDRIGVGRDGYHVAVTLTVPIVHFVDNRPEPILAVVTVKHTERVEYVAQYPGVSQQSDRTVGVVDTVVCQVATDVLL